MEQSPKVEEEKNDNRKWGDIIGERGVGGESLGYLRPDFRAAALAISGFELT
jgi:hypothetical protein